MKSVVVWTFKILFILSATMGCSGAKKASTTAKLPPTREQQLVKMFEAGNKLMDEEQFEQAAAVFEKARVTNPASTLEGLLLYNTALSYQLAGNCQKAHDKFRLVVNFAQKDSPNLLARAKHKIGEVLSCLGEDQKAIVSLVEAYNSRKHLPPAIGEAEVPARLALLYSRIGQKKIAEKYLNIAERGLAQLNNQQELLGDTLFAMGDVSRVTGEKLPWQKYVSSYDVFKKYLLRAVDIGAKPSAERSVETIREVIARLWESHGDILIDEKAPDQAMAAFKAKTERKDLLKALLIQITESQNLMSPNKDANPYAQRLAGLLKSEELKVKNELAAESVGVEKTTEAKRLEAIRREGQVKSDPTVLEKKSESKKK